MENATFTHMPQLNFEKYLGNKREEKEINPEKEKQNSEIYEILNQESGFATMTPTEQKRLIDEVLNLIKKRAMKAEIKESLEQSPFFKDMTFEERHEFIDDIYERCYKTKINIPGKVMTQKERSGEQKKKLDAFPSKGRNASQRGDATTPLRLHDLIHESNFSCPDQ